MEPDAWQIIIGAAAAALGGGGISGAVIRADVKHMIENAKRIEQAVTRAHQRIDDHERRVTTLEVLNDQLEPRRKHGS